MGPPKGDTWGMLPRSWRKPETNDFDIADVMNSVSDKLVHRHPHIYGSTKVKDDVLLMYPLLQQKQLLQGNSPFGRIWSKGGLRIKLAFVNIFNKLLISESGFKDRNDLAKIKNETGINNFLIGESLMKSSSIKECFQKFIK